MRVAEVFTELVREGVPFVLIGGAALTAHGSTRVSLDTDIAIKALDTDAVVRACYRRGLRLVTAVDAEERPVSAETAEGALDFLRDSRQGFMKFLSKELELDFVYDNPVPFMKLLALSREVALGGVGIRLASLEHLKAMKELSVRNRDDDEKRKTDLLDLEFIRRKLAEGG